MSSNVCIYHKGCLDGFGAAWVVNKALLGDCEFVAARYGDDPPSVAGKHVWIVDFSYPREALIQMKKEAESIIVLDHHESAQRNLDGLDFAVFDMEKSGCILTWEHFYGEIPPFFLQLIQDRDLWKFSLDSTKAVNAAIFSMPMDFEAWNKFESLDYVSRLLTDGEAILRDRDRVIGSLASGWAVRRVTIMGYNVPMLNCPRYLASDVLHKLAEGEPFAISYFDDKDRRNFELRSAEDGVNVSEIAAAFGGGGHAHAAGFQMDLPEEDYFK